MAKFNKRKSAYWDAIYTNSSPQLTIHDWNFTNNKGPASLVFEAGRLIDLIRKNNIKNYTCRDISFSTCDFEGRFEGEEISFRKCKFTMCDFGGSFWKSVKFSECEFEGCSFTMVEFDSCQFYQCHWSKISISGTETKLLNTLITNPSEFNEAAFTCQDPVILSGKSKTAEYQLMRLENTKAKIARSVWKNSEGYGDESAYYSALKTATNQSIKSKKVEATYNFQKKKNKIRNTIVILTCIIEYGILNASGFINKWGQSIVRPAMLGLFIMIGFGILYAIFPGCGNPSAGAGDNVSRFISGIVQGFDITFLVGYTKYATFKLPLTEQALYALNAFMGLWWYAILVPTVINKLSRPNT